MWQVCHYFSVYRFQSAVFRDNFGRESHEKRRFHANQQVTGGDSLKCAAVLAVAYASPSLVIPINYNCMQKFIEAIETVKKTVGTKLVQNTVSAKTINGKQLLFISIIDRKLKKV